MMESHKENMPSKSVKNIFIVIAFFAVITIILWLLQCLLVPKYMSDIPEGALIAEYYRDEGKHDVIFVGDCEVYENFSPITLWEKYGITSYIRGSAQQLIWQSYYLLEEMFEYETPEVVVFNVLSMKYGEPQNEAYNRLNIDGMKLSSSKIECAKASMTDEEDLITYIFPILRYHARWSELLIEDFEYMFHRDRIGHSGYLMQTDIRPVESFPVMPPLADATFSDVCWYYLDRISLICEENGAELVLIKAPSLYPHWYDEWEMQIEEYADSHGIKYYNLLEVSDEIGIDWSTDTYDKGLHLNVYGAEKLSEYFGKILSEELGVSDKRSSDEDIEIWKEKCDIYYREKENN